VNPTLVLTFWRQRLMSPIRMAFLFFIVTFPLLVTLAVPQTGFAAAGNVTGIALVFAIGLIGQDFSSGVLQLLFARPVRRWEYVTSRWLGAGSLAALVGIAQAVLIALLMTVRGAAPGAAETLAFAGERVLGAFGLAAVFVLLSSLVAGVGDVALWIAGQGILAISALVAQAKGWMAAGRVLGELQAALNPSVPITQIANGLAPWAPTSAYLSAIAICLTLAVMLVNRRELSYASSNG
jgi:ABC-type transport system involved in multi-copper enzyme maturation permease subunit